MPRWARARRWPYPRLVTDTEDDWGNAVCPRCRATLCAFSDPVGEARCSGCGEVYARRNGIWNFLPGEREQAFAAFLADYTKIRHAEGRAGDAATIRALPDCPASHAIAGQWALRRRTHACLARRVLPGLPRAARILDLGAGVGWLSNRLAQAGFRPCAVDLSADDEDGLGAARHFAPEWSRLRAEFDHLPLIDDVADAAIFNASLHYATDYAATLREARRVVRPGGRIVVLETPIYQDAESGRQMVAERHADFEKRFATRSDSLASRDFLTWAEVDDLGRELDLDWQRIHPWYGWRWAARPVLALLRGGREPAAFVILSATVQASPS